MSQIFFGNKTQKSTVLAADLKILSQHPRKQTKVPHRMVNGSPIEYFMSWFVSLDTKNDVDGILKYHYTAMILNK